ncbi:Uncharacterized protein APZ42_009541 [Daphnia magna]|uniref:Uncharacterized protein n=1 Tax=Daphnia magna TaxID=35525 RepID=A0A162CYN4_9CRUS|nr:Uncharacterized protein APZ42_009541 [Daphnia magna]
MEVTYSLIVSEENSEPMEATNSLNVSEEDSEPMEATNSFIVSQEYDIPVAEADNIVVLPINTITTSKERKKTVVSLEENERRAITNPVNNLNQSCQKKNSQLNRSYLVFQIYFINEKSMCIYYFLIY